MNVESSAYQLSVLGCICFFFTKIHSKSGTTLAAKGVPIEIILSIFREVHPLVSRIDWPLL